MRDGRFRSGGACKKSDVRLDPHLVLLMVLTSAAGWLMIQAGLLKNLLDRRRDRRVCPSCGRDAATCGCGSA